MSFSQRIKTNFQETTYFTDYTDGGRSVHWVTAGYAFLYCLKFAFALLLYLLWRLTHC